MTTNTFHRLHRRRRRPHPRSKARGLSLIELMIAITIGLMLLAGVVTVFSNTSAARNEVDRTARQIENGRYAVELITDEIRLAGFYGELSVGSIATPSSLPDPCSTSTADWASAIPVHLQGYNDAVGTPSCLGASVKSATDVLTVRRARACVAGVSGCPAAASGSPYIQVSLCSTESTTTPYVLGLQGTASYTLHQKDCTTVAGLRQYFANTYFISTDNGAGQNIPTLKRIEMTGSGTTVTPLVEGIEQLQFIYGIDNTGDGLPDAYTPDPSTYTYTGCASCTAATNWTNVMTVEIRLIARNLETSPGYTDGKTYDLGVDSTGNAVTVGPFGDGYRRRLYTETVRVVNAAGRRDTP